MNKAATYHLESGCSTHYVSHGGGVTRARRLFSCTPERGAGLGGCEYPGRSWTYRSKRNERAQSAARRVLFVPVLAGVVVGLCRARGVCGVCARAAAGTRARAGARAASGESGGARTRRAEKQTCARLRHGCSHAAGVASRALMPRANRNRGSRTPSSAFHPASSPRSCSGRRGRAPCPLCGRGVRHGGGGE